MATRTPLKPLHVEGEGLLALYGRPEAGIELVEAFDPIEVEYAAIRTGCAIIDQPHRGVIAVSGADRLSFLNRMLTQELKGLGEGAEGAGVRRSFWLSRKGRIEADLRVIAPPPPPGPASAGGASWLERGEGTVLLELDAHNVAGTIKSLGEYVITEDVVITDLTERTHRLALHGPGAATLLGDAGWSEVGAVRWVEVDGRPVLAFREDSCGEVGLELIVGEEEAARVYARLSTPWSARGPRDAAAPSTDRARRIGWHALNIARIEAGTPLFNIDFGPTNLPHETGAGTLGDRVSFKKGCYLGQEVVARMQSLGHPKQVLVGLRVGSGGGDAAQPTTGTPVVEVAAPGVAAGAVAAEPVVVGAVTSSAASPMLGQQTICFAMVRHSHAVDGRELAVMAGSAAGNGTIPALVSMDLRFWKRA